MSSSSGSAWTDLDRPPLSQQRLAAALSRDGWQLQVVAATGSTNADVVAVARRGAAHGLVVVAEEQASGRGRLDRRWEAPPRSALLLSVLLRPAVPTPRWPLLPFVAGVAVVEAVRAVGRVDATLKWPNDVLYDDRKLGGILVERIDGAAVVGIGLNVSLRDDELPVATATSIGLAGGSTDRESLLKEVLRALGRRYDAWVAADGAAAAVLPAYRQVCATIGRDVSVELPGGGAVQGRVTEVDDAGRLVVVDAAGRDYALQAGDVVHVRAAG